MRIFRSLRFKLAALYLAVFGIIQTALCVGILLARETYMRQDFDEGLLDRAEALADRIELSSPGDSPSTVARSLGTLLNTPRFSEHFVQIRSRDGTIIERSASLGDFVLPWTQPAREVDNANASYQTVSNEAVNELLGSPSELRVLTYWVGDAPAGQHFIQLGRSLGRVQTSIAALRQLFIIAIPLGLLASAVGAWFVAQRSLAPISRIVREARSISASDLHRRIEVPRTQDELTEMVAVVNEMLDRIERGFQAQERFIANVSHELKTPLTVLLGEAQVLQRRARSHEEYTAFLTSVQDEMRRLTRIVQSLLTLAQADAGIPLSHREAVSMNEVAAEALQRCDQAAHEHHNTLVLRLPMPEPEAVSQQQLQTPEVFGDADLLATLAENLVRNAIRFSPDGGRVEVEIKPEAECVWLVVRDQGPGIPDQFVDKIFDRFFHVPGNDPRFAGTGLGLAIVKGIVEMHGGEVGVNQRAAQGCEFWVKLPRATSSVAVSSK